MHPRAQRVLLSLITLIGTGSSAQVFQVQGGTSTMLDAQGGSVEFKVPNNDGLSGMGMHANSPDSFSISKYVIRGFVLDDQGVPVEGAGLHIGKQLAYTDSSGRFMVRFSKRGSFPLSLASEEFLTHGVYQVVSAPAQVQAESEDSVSDVRVVVRRVPPPQARLYNQ